jgi:Xylanase inhibitor N-terminal
MLSTNAKLLTTIVTLSIVALVISFEDNSSTSANIRTSNNINKMTTTIAGQGGIVTIPLIPYHVVRRRNLKAALEYEQHNRVNGYPTRRSRRQLYNSRQLIQDRRQQSDASDEAFQAVQVSGLFQGWGTHYADLWCGTPPQRQTVIVDTGSGVTAFPCAECQDCGVPDYHIDLLYDEKVSTSFRKLSCTECLRGSCTSNNGDTCTIGQAYQEGSSWNAYEAIDTCYIGGLHSQPETPASSKTEFGVDGTVDGLDPKNALVYSFPMKFGCQTRLTGLFKTQLADGIMGMDVAEASFWWQMYDAGKISHKAFSLCYSRKDDADPNGTEAGAMSLGGTDTRLHDKSSMVYSETRTREGAGFYVVDIKAVYLRSPGGGDSAKSTKADVQYKTVDISQTDVGNGGRVIVDSGTTDTYFSSSFAEPFMAAWKEMMGTEYNTNPIDLTAEELNEKMPTILFQLHGSIDANKVVQERDGSTGTVVSGLAGDVDPNNPYDVILAIPPSHYFEYNDDIKKYESRFFVNDQSGGVLGANAMMGHDVYFDVDRQRIGWAESTCDYSKIVSKYMVDVNDPAFSTTNYVDEEETKNRDDDNNNNNNKNNKDDESAVPPNDTPTGIIMTDNNHVCSDFTCQLVVSVSILSIVLFVVYRIVVRRHPASGPHYDIADCAELELADKSSYGDDDNNDSDFSKRSNNINNGTNGKSLTYRNGTALPD